MSVIVTRDHTRIQAALDHFLAADAVRGTLLGTIRTSLGDTAWAALDGDVLLAVRSAEHYPVAVLGPWPVPTLSAVLRGLGDVWSVAGAPELMSGLAAEIADGRPVSVRREALHRLDKLRAPAPVGGFPLIAGAPDLATVSSWLSAFHAETGTVRAGLPVQTLARGLVAGGGCWLWRARDGQAVSMACRRPAMHGSARIGPVFTPTQHRGRGYGSAVTAAATRDVLNDGAIPVLYTDLANPTSNKIYHALGYRVVENRTSLTFGAAPGVD